MYLIGLITLYLMCYKNNIIFFFIKYDKNNLVNNIIIIPNCSIWRFEYLMSEYTIILNQLNVFLLKESMPTLSKYTCLGNVSYQYALDMDNLHFYAEALGHWWNINRHIPPTNHNINESRCSWYDKWLWVQWIIINAKCWETITVAIIQFSWHHFVQHVCVALRST